MVFRLVTGIAASAADHELNIRYTAFYSDDVVCMVGSILKSDLKPSSTTVLKRFCPRVLTPGEIYS